MLLTDRELAPDLRPRSRFAVEALLDFSNRRVKEAMRPAKDVFVIDANELGSLSLMFRRIQGNPYSRVPVSSDGTLEKTQGVLLVKDLLFTFATSGLINLTDILRPCPVVQDMEKLGKVLELFRGGAGHMALVKDAAGKTLGIITLEDVIEEIVGEIKDEFK